MMTRNINTTFAAFLTVAAALLASEASAQFSATQTNDWSPEIPSGTYTHAVNFTQVTGPIVVNGVSFEQATNTSGFTNGDSPDWSNVFGSEDPNNVTGDNGLANRFIHDGGTTASFNLTGLTPGEDYLFKLFSVAFGGDRTTTFDDLDVSGEEFVFDVETAGNNNGNVISYLYTAQPDGELNLALSFATNSPPHTNAISNEFIASPSAVPEPSALLLAGLALLGLASFTWRRRSPA